MDTGEIRPDLARDADEFVALLRRLKDGSGCTYQQLEQRAADLGEVLPRSTIADVLSKRTLPRPKVLAAFVRACDGSPGDVDAWLSARERLAAGDPPAASEDPPSAPAQTPPATRRRTRIVWVLAACVAAVLVAGGAWALLRDDDADRPANREVPPGLALPAAGSWARIHPARTPDLCVTEGREHTLRYENAIAVQRPCDGGEPPRTFLKPVRDNLFHIQWNHPEFGVGCLTVRADDPVRGMLEPWDDCGASRSSQLFRAEPIEAPGRYRLHPAHSDLCLGIRDNETETGAEVLQEPCTTDPDQIFLITLL